MYVGKGILETRSCIPVFAIAIGFRERWELNISQSRFVQGNLRAEFTEHDMSDQREERGDGSGSDGVVRTELTSGWRPDFVSERGVWGQHS